MSGVAIFKQQSFFITRNQLAAAAEQDSCFYYPNQRLQKKFLLTIIRCLVVLERAFQKFNKCYVIYHTSRYSEIMTILLPICLLLVHVTWKANAYNL